MLVSPYSAHTLTCKSGLRAPIFETDLGTGECSDMFMDGGNIDDKEVVRSGPTVTETTNDSFLVPQNPTISTMDAFNNEDIETTNYREKSKPSTTKSSTEINILTSIEN